MTSRCPLICTSPDEGDAGRCGREPRSLPCPIPSLALMWTDERKRGPGKSSQGALGRIKLGHNDDVRRKIKGTNHKAFMELKYTVIEEQAKRLWKGKGIATKCPCGTWRVSGSRPQGPGRGSGCANGAGQGPGLQRWAGWGRDGLQPHPLLQDGGCRTPSSRLWRALWATEVFMSPCPGYSSSSVTPKLTASMSPRDRR